MEIHSSLVGAIIVLICVVPFIIIRINSKHREKSKINALIEKGKEQGLTINETEVFADFIVGLDTNKKIFYFQPSNEFSAGETIIELSNIRVCQIQKTTRKVVVDGQISFILEQLALEFFPIGNMLKPYKLIFYNAEDRMQLYGELQSIELWEKRIKELIS